MNRQLRSSRHGESGVVLLALFITLMPILLLVATTTTALERRSHKALTSVDQDRALLAAEAGVDRLLFVANTTGLVANQTIDGTLGPDLTYSATAIDMSSDGADNDGDTFIDEADENAHELRVMGSYRGSRRALVAYVRPMMQLPVIESAMSFQNFSSDLDVELDVSGNAFTIKGNDVNLDGTAGPGPNLPGVTIVQPGSTEDLLDDLTAAQQNRITGAGGTPSATTTTTSFDMNALAGQVQSVAHNYLTPGTHSPFNATLGNAANNDWQITYAAGNLDLTGNLTGAGVLVVMGNLKMAGTLEFKGLVIVTGNIDLSGGGSGSLIRGSLIAGADAMLKGTVDIEYSNQAMTAVRTELADKQVITGWREVAH